MPMRITLFCLAIFFVLTFSALAQIVVSVDKEEYVQGEVVEVVVTNDSDVPIWYARYAECGSSFWVLKDCQLKECYYYWPCKWPHPQHYFEKLEPKGSLKYEWNGETWDTQEEDFKLIEPGCFVVVFPYINANESPTSFEWEADQKGVHSPKFRIKEF